MSGRDALAVLGRLRDAMVAEAREALAEASAAERRASQRLDAHLRDMARERAEAADGQVDDFAAWLSRARQQADRLRATLTGAEAQTARARALLAERRVEAEAVAKARQRRDAEAKLAAARREQAAMDEAAGRGSARAEFGESSL